MDLEELSRNITNEIKKMQDDKAISEMYKTQLAIKSAMTDERQKERELDILDEKNKIAKMQLYVTLAGLGLSALKFAISFGTGMVIEYKDLLWPSNNAMRKALDDGLRP